MTQMFYHYTRLTKFEINHIRKHGLLPLSEEVFLIKEKVLQERGINVHLNRTALNPELERVGKICFVTKSQIESEDFEMVESLCRFWGGEAVSDWYCNEGWYEEILKASLPVEISFELPDGPIYNLWGERLTKTEGEGYTTVCVLPKYIKGIKSLNLA